MRMYLLLVRFTALALLTAAIDNAVFALTLGLTGSIGRSQALARLLAMILNYLGARRFVFHSRQRHAIVIPKYVFLVVSNGFLSYALIRVLQYSLSLRTMSAKLLAEGFLFIASFAIQKFRETLSLIWMNPGKTSHYRSSAISCFSFPAN